MRGWTEEYNKWVNSVRDGSEEPELEWVRVGAKSKPNEGWVVEDERRITLDEQDTTNVHILRTLGNADLVGVGDVENGCVYLLLDKQKWEGNG